MNKKGQGTAVGVSIVVFVFALFFGLIFLVMSIDTVDASHRGVMVKFGDIKGVMEPGIKFTGPFVQVNQYNLRTRKLSVEMKGNQGAVDKDGQAVYGIIEINYRLKGDNVDNTYSNIGLDRDGNLENILNIDGIIREGFKSITSQYTSIEIFQKRQEVKEKALEKIQGNFPSEYFILENVIISNIDFNPAFKAAIELRKVAEETAKARTEEVKIAQAQAQLEIAKAEGLKQKVQLEADAEAYRTLKQAEAEAKSLELKSAQLTLLMVENNRLDMMRETWDGSYPKWVTGDTMSMFMQMGTEAVE